jgi:hypothetical protein
MHAVRGKRGLPRRASLKLINLRSQQAYIRDASTPDISLNDLPGAPAAAPIRRRNSGNGLATFARHNRGKTCIRTCRSSLPTIAAEGLYRNIRNSVLK